MRCVGPGKVSRAGFVEDVPEISFSSRGLTLVAWFGFSSARDRIIGREKMHNIRVSNTTVLSWSWSSCDELRRKIIM